MKTPQEKAEELVDKYIQTNGNSFFAKQCALIAVDEILTLDFIDDVFIPFSDKSLKEYYQEVKQEIELL